MLQNLTRAVFTVALLAGIRSAHADPVGDFKTGTTIVLHSGTVAGLTALGGGAISKPAGTLDFTIDAADLGVPLPVAVHLHGSSLGNNRVRYTFDERYPRPVDIGGGHTLSRLTGQLDTSIARLPGAVVPRVGNVRLKLAGNTSYLEGSGDWGTARFTVTDLDLIGGIPQPALVDFGNGSSLVCSNTVDTAASLTVALADIAPTGGAVVDLAGPLLGVRVPPGIVVFERSRSAIVRVRVEANFVGTVHLTAAAGGATRSLDLTVHDRRACGG